MSTGNKRAIVVGPYRTHNFGDDLVGAILARHLQAKGYETVVPKLGEDNCEWLGIKFEPSYDGMFDDVDVVVLGGGGIMSDTSGAKPGASYLEIVTRAAMAGKLAGKKVYITSVGAGPWILEKSKMLAFGVSLLANKIGVRETESYEHLRALGVGRAKLRLGADLALLTPDLLDFAQTPGPKVGLQFDVKSFPDIQENPELPKIVGLLEEYARSHDGEVALLRNGKSRSDLAGAAPDAERLSYTDLSSFLPRLSGLRSILHSHLHLAITAYSMRIPTFSLYAREKTRRFYEQIGRPERAVNLGTATAADLERLLNEATTVKWTDEDEKTLQELRVESRKLIEFVV